MRNLPALTSDDSFLPQQKTAVETFQEESKSRNKEDRDSSNLTLSNNRPDSTHGQVKDTSGWITKNRRGIFKSNYYLNVGK